MAGGTMKIIRRRIKSVESTGQITKAMELVASSKLRRAKERAQSAEPFFEALYQTICDIASINNESESKFVVRREIKAVLMIVIAGDRGLAGGYNSNILRLADAAIAKQIEQGKEVKIIAIGKKAAEYYAKRPYEIVASYIGVAEHLDQLRVSRIADRIVDLYQTDAVDEIRLFYTQFVSALSQTPFEMPVLPLANIDSGEQSKEFVEYDPSPAEVFDAIVPSYISWMLYCAVVESFASEQGARRTAMESASDNVSEMIDKLSLKYNRARQAAITQEITEIVSGANAL